MNSFLHSARKNIKAKAAELLGDDGVASVKSWGDDAKSAGDQIRLVAKEVSDDCDSELLRNARSFYAGAYRKARAGIRKNVKAAKQSARQQKAIREERLRLQELERRRRVEERRRNLKKALILIVCVLAVLLLLISAALSIAEHGSSGTPQKNTAAAPVQQTAAPQSFTAEIRISPEVVPISNVPLPSPQI